MKNRGNIFTCVFTSCVKYFAFNVVCGKIPTQKLILKNLKGTFFKYTRAVVNYKYPRKCIGLQVVSSNEHGVLGETYHTHLLTTVNSKQVVMTPLVTMPPPITVEKGQVEVPLNVIRRFIKRRCKLLRDIRAVRSLAANAKYITKEDMDGLVKNIDKEILHPDWIAYQIAKRFPVLDDGFYQVRRWNNEFSYKKFKRIYQLYYDNKIRTTAIEHAKLFVNDELMQMLTPSKKGLYIYGSPGTGKTSTVTIYADGKAFELREGKCINQFALSKFNNEKYIWMDDVTVKDVISNQGMIKQLTDDRGYTVGERKGGDTFLVSTQKVIMTSNETPTKLLSDILGFERRFDVVKVTKEECVRNQRSSKRGLFKDD